MKLGLLLLAFFSTACLGNKLELRSTHIVVVFKSPTHCGHAIKALNPFPVRIICPKSLQYVRAFTAIYDGHGTLQNTLGQIRKLNEVERAEIAIPKHFPRLKEHPKKHRGSKK